MLVSVTLQVSSIWITSPIPEEAPVMWTTLPATFSGKNAKIMERKNLKVQYGGKKRSKEKKVNGGATMFRNWWIRSITKKKIAKCGNNNTLVYLRKMLNLKLKFGIYIVMIDNKKRNGVRVEIKEIGYVSRTECQV